MTYNWMIKAELNLWKWKNISYFITALQQISWHLFKCIVSNKIQIIQKTIICHITMCINLRYHFSEKKLVYQEKEVWCRQAVDQGGQPELVCLRPLVWKWWLHNVARGVLLYFLNEKVDYSLRSNMPSCQLALKKGKQSGEIL